MEALNIVLTSEDQIPALLKKSRREIKDLVRISPIAQRTESQDVVDDIIERSVDDIPMREWPVEASVRFVSVVCGLAQLAIETEAPALPQNQGRLETFSRLADLLLSFAAALPNRFEKQTKQQLCRLWIGSRLAPGLSPQDCPIFISAAVAALTGLGIESNDLLAQIQGEVLGHITKQFQASITQSYPPPEKAAAKIDSPVAASDLTAKPRDPVPGPVPEEVSEPRSDPHMNRPTELDASSTAVLVGVPSPPLDSPTEMIPPAEVDPDRTLAAPENPPQKGPAPNKPHIGRWQQPFQTESEVVAKFPDLVEEALRQVELLPPSARRSGGLLENAKREYLRWIKEGQVYGNTGFLATAIDAAGALATALVRANQPAEAYRVCNPFTEIAKMLIPRNREKFQPLYDDLIVLACQTVSEVRLSDPDVHTGNGQPGDIERLTSDLERLLQYALGTKFRMSDRSFVRGPVDTALQERVITDVIAAHFDKRLRHLLETDQPKVKQYVRTNMPVVFRKKLSGDWIQAKQQWEGLLTNNGFEDVVRTLRDMGDLVDPEQMGRLPADTREEISRSAAANDYARVMELLADSIKDLRGYLYTEAQRLLQYREPPPARPRDENARELFRRGQRFAKAVDRRSLERAFGDLQNAWQLDIANLELLEWVAYVEARTGNLQGAEKKFLKRQQASSQSFITDWNLAVLKYERKNEKEAYQLLLPLLKVGQVDNDLILVVLALSLKLDDKACFLATVPRTMSLRYHPIAIKIAYEMKNIPRMEELLAPLLAQSREKWELPPVDTRFINGLEELRQTVVNKAIVEDQTEQLIPWLEARIKAVKTWIPNYLALAWVLENQSADVEGAFRVLRSRLEMVRRRRPRPDDESDVVKHQRSIDEACEDLLELCRRKGRADLGQEAYGLTKQAQGREGLLQGFGDFSPVEPSKNRPLPEPLPPTPSPEPPIQSFRDPKLADRVMWVNAGLVKIRHVHSYLEKAKEIEEFTRIVGEVGPTESAEALALIRNITAVIETFSKTDADDGEDRATRRTLYSRVAGFEKELAQLLQGDVLSRPVADLITPYRQALQQVVGDLSRLAGVGPVLDVIVENPFLSLESSRSTIILRVTDKSERAVTDITVEAVSENPAVRIVGSKRRQIPRIESQLSELLSIPTERSGTASQNDRSEVTVAVSLRASAEGFPDVDLGIKKLTFPIRTFAEVMGNDQIPKLFQEGPLDPSEPQLFHGRTGLLNSFRNSFYGGVQRERYFFDGIRRVGKTSLLKFLPSHVPESSLPVLADFDLLGIQGRFSSANVLKRFCLLIAAEVKSKQEIELDVPSDSAFETDPGIAFAKFLEGFATGLPGRVPLLMMDEFQDLLIEIAHSGSNHSRDTLVLTQLRGQLDAQRLNAVFTGSVRFDRLTQLGAESRIFGNLKRLPVSFLNEESVRDVLRAGMGRWGLVPPETAASVYALTGGYPWLVQKYGLELINRLNNEHRTIAGPKDVEDITNDIMLWDNSLFKYWWPVDQLEADEERFIEWLFRKYPQDQPILSKSFFADVGHREQQKFRLAFENLRACEVLDSTQAEYIRFSGGVMRRWLQGQLQEGQLHIPKGERPSSELRGQAGIFIDHENFMSSLEEISAARGVPVPERNSPGRLRWFQGVLNSVMAEAERRIGPLSHKVAVAFWSRPHEAEVSPAYQRFDFQLKEPVYTGKHNEADFKMADEARRARERAVKENSTLSRAIVVTGDSDLSQVVSGLKNDGVSVQVIGGSRNTGVKYVLVVGSDNFIALQDVCGL